MQHMCTVLYNIQFCCIPLSRVSTCSGPLNWLCDGPMPVDMKWQEQQQNAVRLHSCHVIRAGVYDWCQIWRAEFSCVAHSLPSSKLLLSQQKPMSDLPVCQGGRAC